MTVKGPGWLSDSLHMMKNVRVVSVKVSVSAGYAQDATKGAHAVRET